MMHNQGVLRSAVNQFPNKPPIHTALLCLDRPSDTPKVSILRNKLHSNQVFIIVFPDKVICFNCICRAV